MTSNEETLQSGLPPFVGSRTGQKKYKGPPFGTVFSKIFLFNFEIYYTFLIFNLKVYLVFDFEAFSIKLLFCKKLEDH